MTRPTGMKLLILITLLNSSLFSWPWPSNKGSVGLYIEAGYQNSDEKFSGGNFRDYKKGEPQPYFEDQPGDYSSTTIFSAVQYMVLDQLQIAASIQWSSITWNRTEKVEKSGIKELSVTAAYFIDALLPIKLLGGWTVPNSSQFNKSGNDISISDGTHNPFAGFSTGIKAPWCLYIYTTHVLNMPLEQTYSGIFNISTTKRKPLSVTSNFSVILPITDTYEVTTSYSGSTPFRETQIEQAGITFSEQTYSYHTLSFGLGHTIGSGKIHLSISKPLAGVEVPTGALYKISWGMNISTGTP